MKVPERPGLNDAVLLIDKPAGFTSNDVLTGVKRITGLKKAGHSGTLDKFASGLLVVCSGKLTRLANYFLGHDKWYSASIRLGVTTDTLDPGGAIIEEKPVKPFDDGLLREIEREFTGTLIQRPPEYSALKIGGKRASDLKRSGKQVDLQSREVRISEIQLARDSKDPTLLFADIQCSKGTYIRALARDIGEYIGTGAHLESLRRTASGPFNINRAVTPDELAKYVDTGSSGKNFILAPEEALSGFGVLIISPDAERKVDNGALFGREDVQEAEPREGVPHMVLNGEKKLIAIVDIDFDKWSIRYLNVFSGR